MRPKTRPIPPYRPTRTRRPCAEARARALGPLVAAATLAAGAATGSPLLGATRPVPVSPGESHRAARTATTCPTFSWGSVSKARAYELAVFAIGPGEAVEPEDAPALRQRVVAAASSWTVPLERCLEPGRYAWVLRAQKKKDGSFTPWSRPAMFEIAEPPARVSEAEFQEALEVVRRYLADRPEPAVAEAPHAVSEARREPVETPGATFVTGEAPTPGAPLNNLGGGIFSATSGSSSAAIRGSNTQVGSETNKGYLGVQGSTDFDSILFLDSAITGNEIGVLGVSAGTTDNYGVVGITSGGWGGRFFNSAGNQSEVRLGSSDTAVRLIGNNQNDLRINFDNGGGNHYIFDDISDSNALKIESAFASDLVFNTNGAIEALRLTTSGDAIQHLTDNGLAKAWAKVAEDGSLVSCYRCASSSKVATGTYRVSFSPLGTDIRARPRLATPDSHTDFATATNRSIAVNNVAGNTTTVGVWTRIASNGDPFDTAFTIVIY